MKLTKAIPSVEEIQEIISNHQVMVINAKTRIEEINTTLGELEDERENVSFAIEKLQATILELTALEQEWSNSTQVIPNWPLDIRNLTLKRGRNGSNWVVADSSEHRQNDLINVLLAHLQLPNYRNFTSLTVNLLVKPREITVELLEGLKTETTYVHVNLKDGS